MKQYIKVVLNCVLSAFFLCLTGTHLSADTDVTQMGGYLNVDVTTFLEMEAKLQQFDTELTSLSLKIDAATNEYVTLEDAEAGITGLASSTMLRIHMLDYLQKYTLYAQDKLLYEKTMLSALEYEYALAQADNDIREMIISSNYIMYLPSTETAFSTPVHNPYVTSEYGNRLHPVFNVERIHTGIDLVSTTADYDIFAAAEGIVTLVDYSVGYGNYVVVNHGDYDTLYAHLDNVIVQENTIVTPGTILGVMGTTGISTGVHLHFEIRETKTGTTLNPRLFIMFDDAYDIQIDYDIAGPVSKEISGETSETDLTTLSGNLIDSESDTKEDTMYQLVIPDELIGSPYLQMSSELLLQLIQESRLSETQMSDDTTGSFGLASTEYLELAYAYVLAIESYMQAMENSTDAKEPSLDFNQQYLGDDKSD